MKSNQGVTCETTHLQVYRARASDVTITKKWVWPTDFVWQKSMEVYGKPLTMATSVVAKLPSVRLVPKTYYTASREALATPGL